MVLDFLDGLNDLSLYDNVDLSFGGLSFKSSDLVCFLVFLCLVYFGYRLFRLFKKLFA